VQAMAVEAADEVTTQPEQSCLSLIPLVAHIPAAAVAAAVAAAAAVDVAADAAADVQSALCYGAARMCAAA